MATSWPTPFLKPPVVYDAGILSALCRKPFIIRLGSFNIRLAVGLFQVGKGVVFTRTVFFNSVGRGSRRALIIPPQERNAEKLKS